MSQHKIQLSWTRLENKVDVVAPLINNRRLRVSPTVRIQEEEPVTVVEPMMVYPPIRIPYEDTKAVPWNYEPEVIVGGKPMVLG